MPPIRPGRSLRWSALMVGGAMALFGGAQSRPIAAADDAPAPKSVTPTTAAKLTTSTGSRLDYIDAMLKEKCVENSIKPSRKTSDEEFLRRAYLDVLGRIPNIREANDFLAAKDAGKRAKLVEYLLNSPDYAKNFATQWKVILLGRKGQPRDVNAEVMTAWLRRQFGANRPWNEMAYELLTATGSNKEVGPTNYTLAHMADGAVNLTSITTRVFLGQQIQCTQCHDHPTNDKWKQQDFWGINAFYKGLKKEDVTAANAAGTEAYDHTILSDEPTDKFSSYERRDARLGVAFPTFLDGRKISQDSDVDRREALGRMITEPSNPNFAQAFVNRTWGHFFGRAFVNPVDDFGPHNAPSHPELLAKLGDDFRNSGYDIKSLIRWIMNSDAYQVTSMATKENEKDESLFSHMSMKPMTPEQLFDSLIVATAAHRAGGEDTSKNRDQWLRQFVFTFANDEGEEGSSFQGTIPQALMMMNGDLMERAVGGRAGSFLADVLEKAQLQKNGSEAYVVNQLYLAALSRQPTRTELTRARQYLTNNMDTICVMEDMFWALLNSNEFVLNR